VSIVGTPEWDRAVADYIAAREAAAANNYQGWEHAECDHGSGYCGATVSNTFEPETRKNTRSR
jgi:hypothetical protein